MEENKFYEEDSVEMSAEDFKTRNRLIRTLSSLTEETSDKEDDFLLKSVYQLTDLALRCRQYEKVVEDVLDDTEKVCLVRTKFSCSDLKVLFGVDPVNVYGTGIFLPLEGIILGPCSRERSCYDQSLEGKSFYDVSFLPEDIVKSHEIRLSIPAMSGLFIPKKTEITEHIYSIKCLKYLDVS